MGVVVQHLNVVHHNVGARVNHAAAAIAAAARGVGRRVVVLNNHVAQRGKAGPVQGVEHSERATLPIKYRVVLESDVRQCQRGVARTRGTVAASIEIESSSETVLSGAAVAAVSTVLDRQVRHADSGVCKGCNVLVE